MSDLEAIYKNALYVVDAGPLKFTIRLDNENNSLREFLRLGKHTSWAFLTAYNPNSQPRADAENAARQSELVADLERKGFTTLEGYGTGENWHPEPSLFVLDIRRDEAIAVGTRFGQNAILWGSIDSDPELVWCGKPEA
ncbi:MAG: DUF3293 domain-containing protein [Pyrinomonadaceae bacterium]